jgi:anti-sigma factor ChrR (cupin superfamily)
MNSAGVADGRDSEFAAVEAALFDALAPIELSPERALALRERVLARAAGAPIPEALDEPGFVTIRKADAGWLQVMPGVHAKLLHTEGSAQSYLVRLEPGARAPAHDHPGIEECIVLEGEVQYLGSTRLRAGDYQLAKEGAHHSDLVSETGALVFLRYAQPLENYIRR